MLFERPADVVVVKGGGNLGRGRTVSINGVSHVYNDSTLFGIWRSGLIRVITPAEWTVWGSPGVDYTIPAGREHDAEWLALTAYDAALKG